MNYTHRVTVRRLVGTPYSVYAIVLSDGCTVHRQISPYTDAEIAERIASFINPPPAPPPRAADFMPSAKRGPKPKGTKVADPFDWRTPNLEDA